MWIVTVLLLASLALNFIGYWYVRKALTKLLFVSDHLDYMDTSLKAFKANLDAVYEAERFYGDETLEALCLHAKEVANDIDMFSEIVEIYEMEDLDIEENNEEGENVEEAEENSSKKI